MSGTNLITASATLKNVNDEIDIGPLMDHNVVTCKFLGTITATVQCEVSNDPKAPAPGASWNNALCEQANAQTAATSSQDLKGDEMVFANCAGYTWMRFRVTSVTSGSCTAYARATNAVPRAHTA